MTEKYVSIEKLKAWITDHASEYDSFSNCIWVEDILPWVDDPENQVEEEDCETMVVTEAEIQAGVDRNFTGEGDGLLKLAYELKQHLKHGKVCEGE